MDNARNARQYYEDPDRAESTEPQSHRDVRFVSAVEILARRKRAADELLVALRRRSYMARMGSYAESRNVPTLVVANVTLVPWGYIEVRSGLGAVDWFAWQSGDRIAPADSPEHAAQLIIEALS